MFRKIAISLATLTIAFTSVAGANPVCKPVKDTIIYPSATQRVPAKYVGFLQDGHCLLVKRYGHTPVLYCLHVEVDTYLGH